MCEYRAEMNLAKLAVLHGPRGTLGHTSPAAATEHDWTNAATRCGGSV